MYLISIGNTFNNSYVLNSISSEEEGYKFISKYLQEHGIKCYYIRSWKEDRYTAIDYGSHSNFFYISYQTGGTHEGNEQV